MKKQGKEAESKVRVGWREWIVFPRLDGLLIKAKVDTGARTSSLHAFGIEDFRRRGRDFVRFEIHPEQRSSRRAQVLEMPVHDRRRIKSSSGHTELRPVILTTIEILDRTFDVELTLTGRDEMGFRMLLGRQAMRGRFLVDPGTSFLNGRRIKGAQRLRRRPR